MPTAGAREPRSGLVMVTSGHLVDEPGRSPPRFPEARIPAVASRIRALFEDWSVGAGDLVISGGARGADILFAESALDRGASVRLMLALPPTQFVQRSVASPGGRWEKRFYRLLPHCQVDILPKGRLAAGQNRFEMVNTWMLDEALRLPGRVVAVLVWDELPAQKQGGTAGMAALLRRREIPTTVINPLPRRNDDFPASMP